jgi:hypothetical protein
MQKMCDQAGETMKRLFYIALGLLAMIGLPLAAEAIAPSAPAPDPPLVAAELILIPDPTPATDPEPEPSPRYSLTPEERIEIEMTVMAEAGGECWEGQCAVAQCILNAAELEGIRPTEVLTEYKYTSRRIEPSESIRHAVATVFDKGEELIDTSILYFYAPTVTRSAWHESQEFAIEIGRHRFFRPKGG